MCHDPGGQVALGDGIAPNGLDVARPEVAEITRDDMACMYPFIVLALCHCRRFNLCILFYVYLVVPASARWFIPSSIHPSIHPSNPIPSHPIPSHPIPSHPIHPSIHPSLHSIVIYSAIPEGCSLCLTTMSVHVLPFFAPSLIHSIQVCVSTLTPVLLTATNYLSGKSIYLQ